MDDSNGSVGDKLNDFCLLWLEAASGCAAPEDGWIPKIIRLNDSDDCGCRRVLLPNAHILLSMEEMRELYDYYKNEYLENNKNTGSDRIFPYKFTYSVNMGRPQGP